MDSTLLVLVILGFFIGFFGIGLTFHRKRLTFAHDLAQQEQKRLLEEARKESDQIVKQALREAKDEARKSRQKFEDDSKNRRTEITKLEQKLKSREDSIDKRLAFIERRELEIELATKKTAAEEQLYHKLAQDCEVTLEKARKTLQSVANMSVEEAKRELIKSLEVIAKKEAQASIEKIEEQAKQEASYRAKSIVSLAVQRTAGEYVSDATISVVSLPGEEMKGRIIGREGRNIRAIEQATGVDIIIDDTPEAVIISCFNPIRREVAKITLERLIADGRIHPARIEETAKRVIAEFDTITQENGERASLDIGITDLHPELVKLLGRLKYRTVGQQSLLQHSLETAQISSFMASELGISAKKAKRAGLLHDIGSALDEDVEGHHADLGADICEKYGESADVVEAIRLHHKEDIKEASPLVVIINAANTLSSSRPGARKELFESFVKRLSDMEKLVKSFPGVSEAYVMQSGREVHAMVDPLAVLDSEVSVLVNDIAAKLRHELTFPGQVRVTIVRENRSVEYAK